MFGVRTRERTAVQGSPTYSKCKRRVCHNMARRAVANEMHIGTNTTRFNFRGGAAIPKRKCCVIYSVNGKRTTRTLNLKWK